MKRKEAFTLVELLVGISIIALLMAVLLPVVHKAGKQAQAVACQARLRQWGLIFYHYTSENEGRFLADCPRNGGRVSWLRMLEAYYDETRQLVTCPGKEVGPYPKWRGGYAMNGYLIKFRPEDPILSRGISDRWSVDTHWGALYATRRHHAVPVLLDRRRWVGGFCYPISQDPPPLYEDCVPTPETMETMESVCSPRHGSFVNSVFMDWSVRRVGLKELWTLKWHREYDTSGPWTKAGGALPEDWPEWMRGFRDY